MIHITQYHPDGTEVAHSRVTDEDDPSHGWLGDTLNLMDYPVDRVEIVYGTGRKVVYSRLYPGKVEGCSACEGDECADLQCPASKRKCGHHCNCVMIHDCCHFCLEEWGEE